jgi:uncharacterized membrane protein YsdA (DUF1294 family)
VFREHGPDPRAAKGPDRRLAPPEARPVIWRTRRGLAAKLLAATLLASAAITCGLRGWLRLDTVLAWLLAINLVTGVVYVYDKLIAGSSRTRIPERALLSLALAGGTPFAYIAMRLLNHKTAKQSFRSRFWPIVAGQMLLLILYCAIRKPLAAG